MDYTKDGEPSRRALYRQRAKQLKTEELFEDEDLPDEVAYFHSLFFEIWNISEGLTYQNLYYWQQIYGIKLSSEIIDMLKKISGKANEFISIKNKPKDKK
jgi:hypothetical protein